jgi:DNA-binding protein HU-beta
MNKAELVHAIAGDSNVTNKVAENMLSSFLSTVMKAVKDGDKVSLVGFGSFHSIVRKARPGRNPATGAKINIPEKTVPKFTPGKEFRDML